MCFRTSLILQQLQVQMQVQQYTFPAKRQRASADKQHVKAARILPLLWTLQARTQSNVGSAHWARCSRYIPTPIGQGHSVHCHQQCSVLKKRGDSGPWLRTGQRHSCRFAAHHRCTPAGSCSRMPSGCRRLPASPVRRQGSGLQVQPSRVQMPSTLHIKQTLCSMSQQLSEQAYC